MNSYYLWTIGCQMNTADSDRLGAALEQLGVQQVEKAADADAVAYTLLTLPTTPHSYASVVALLCQKQTLQYTYNTS